MSVDPEWDKTVLVWAEGVQDRLDRRTVHMHLLRAAHVCASAFAAGLPIVLVFGGGPFWLVPGLLAIGLAWSARRLEHALQAQFERDERTMLKMVGILRETQCVRDKHMLPLERALWAERLSRFDIGA